VALVRVSLVELTGLRVQARLVRVMTVDVLIKVKQEVAVAAVVKVLLGAMLREILGVTVA
tara:strand:+ start:591 stop:770 length:180 start_codon:yes stop_codon:yes gene_type:complete